MDRAGAGGGSAAGDGDGGKFADDAGDGAMTWLGRTLVVLVVAAVAGGAGFWLGRRGSAPEAADEAQASATTEPAEGEVKPVAEVLVAPATQKAITTTISAYGSVVAPSGDVRISSMPIETRVVRVLTAAGQPVAAGAELVQVEPSPDANIQLKEAQAAAAAGEQDFKGTEQQFAQHLATNAALAQSRIARDAARLKLASLTERGADEARTLKADAAGVVSKIDVQAGQIVAAGAPLVEIASGNRIEASLGVEPADAAELKIGQPVKLQPVG